LTPSALNWSAKIPSALSSPAADKVSMQGESKGFKKSRAIAASEYVSFKEKGSVR
jgi:hypothetical protein